MNRRRPLSQVWRVVAIGFLAFTAYELFLAGSCGPELLGIPPEVSAHASAPACQVEVDGPAISSAADGATHDHSDEGGCSMADCFCCCAHIRVPGVFVIGTMDDASVAELVSGVVLPTGPASLLFRPPRTA